MKWVAKPVVVDAWRIIHVGRLHSDGARALVLEGIGGHKRADASMLARIHPVPGDYWVKQEDGYAYLNPRDVFERKYQPLHAYTEADLERMGIRSRS